MSNPFAPLHIVNMTVTDNPAGAVGLPVTPQAAGGSVVITNRGSADVFLAWGGASARCGASGAAAGYCVLARSKEAITLPAATHIYAITGSGLTTDIQIAMGAGE